MNVKVPFLKHDFVVQRKMYALNKFVNVFECDIEKSVFVATDSRI